MTRTLVVLAGGRSTRFGATEKALADVAGRPMLTWVLGQLAPVVDDVVLNCRADQRHTFAAALSDTHVRFAVDPVPDQGPVAGMRTGLATADEGRALVVGCDMPLFDPDTANDLFCQANAADAVVPVAAGRRQPLGSVYHVEHARIACIRAGANSRLLDVLDRLDVHTVTAPTTAFQSIDTTEEIAEVRNEIDGRVGENQRLQVLARS